MYGEMKRHLQAELQSIREAGLYKTERVIESPQSADIAVGGRRVLNFCANNYLGLSDHPRLVEAAREAMEARGFGWRPPSPTTSAQTTRYFTPPVSTPTAGCSNRSSASGTP